VNDADFMLNILKDGREYTTAEILNYSFHERGCGLTPHSRAAELRKRGHTITTRCLGRKNGRAVWAYKLEALRERDTSGPDGSRSRSAVPDALAAGDFTAPHGMRASSLPSEAAVKSPAPQLSLELPGSAFTPRAA
jgi:hypothetical protein